MREEKYETQMVKRLFAAVGNKLVGVVAYGPSVHDDYPEVGEHMLIVTADLEVTTLRQLAEPVRWWLERRQPWPRMFSPELLRDAADVFPIELLDITTQHRVLYGKALLEDVVIDRVQLRGQCERELREKLMRLREGYVEHHADRKGGLRELIAASYPTFVRIFRGCLHLLKVPVPRHDRDVTRTLCVLLDVAPDAFENVERIAQGSRDVDTEAAFAAYYIALTDAERRIDRLVIRREEVAS
jgi:hypothetical protein